MKDRQILPLAILGAAEGGIVSGRTRLMKLVFLAQKESDKELPVHYKFKAYDYGPFAQSLLTDLGELESQGIIEKSVDQIPSGRKYTYKLRERYQNNLQEEFGYRVSLSDEEWDIILNQAEETVSKFNDIPISRLLEHVYNRYAKYTVNSVI